jgi:hypothetical protein
VQAIEQRSISPALRISTSVSSTRGGFTALAGFCWITPQVTA